jgi:hypothetical protein
MIVRFTAGEVAEPFYPSICAWIYRGALVLPLPAVLVGLLRPSSVLPIAIAALGLSIAVIGAINGDEAGASPPVIAGALAGIAGTSIQRPSVLRLLCGVFAACAIVATLLLLVGDIATAGFQSRLGFGWSVAYADSMGHLQGAQAVFNPNESALSLAILLSAALSLPMVTGAFGRIGRWTLAALATAGLIACGSRGMMLAGMVGLIMSIHSLRVRERRRLPVLAILLGFIFVLILIGLIVGAMPDSPFSRRDASENLLSLGDRAPIWEVSLERLMESPVFGPGRALNGREAISPHNAMISVGELSGGVGICISLWLVASAVSTARRSSCLGVPVVACLFAAGLSADTLTSPLAWAILGLVCSPAAVEICAISGGQSRQARRH